MKMVNEMVNLTNEEKEIIFDFSKKLNAVDCKVNEKNNDYYFYINDNDYYRFSIREIKENLEFFNKNNVKEILDDAASMFEGRWVLNYGFDSIPRFFIVLDKYGNEIIRRNTINSIVDSISYYRRCNIKYNDELIYVGPNNKSFFSSIVGGKKIVIPNRSKMQVVKPVLFNDEYVNSHSIHCRIKGSKNYTEISSRWLSRDGVHDLYGDKIDLSSYYDDMINKFHSEMEDIEYKINSSLLDQKSFDLIKDWIKQYGNLYAGFIKNHFNSSKQNNDTCVTHIYAYQELCETMQKRWVSNTISFETCPIKTNEFYYYGEDEVMQRMCKNYLFAHERYGYRKYYPSINSLKRIGYTKEMIRHIRNERLNSRSRIDFNKVRDNESMIDIYWVCSNNREKTSHKIIKIRDFQIPKSLFK